MMSAPHVTTQVIVSFITGNARPTKTYPAAVLSQSMESRPTVTSTTGYAFLNTQSVVLPTQSYMNMPMSESSISTTTATTSSVTVVPTSLPEIVVPNNTNETHPSNTTLIAILFQRSLSWYWIVTQRATTAQIFTYMPKVLSTTLNISESQVYTSKLMMLKSSDKRFTRTLYLGYVPSACTAALKELVQDPHSDFYQQSGSNVEQELVSLVDPTFDPLTYAKSEGNDRHGDVASEMRNALVGSFSGAAGAVVLGVLAWWLRRRCIRKAAADAASKRDTIQSFVDCSVPPKATGDQAAHTSHSYFAGDNDATPSASAFASPRGVNGTIGMRHTSIHPLPTWLPKPVMRAPRTPSSAQRRASYLDRTERDHEVAASHEQLVPYVSYMEELDPTLWDARSFSLEEQGETQQRKNDVLECRVVI